MRRSVQSADPFLIFHWCPTCVFDPQLIPLIAFWRCWRVRGRLGRLQVDDRGLQEHPRRVRVRPEVCSREKVPSDGGDLRRWVHRWVDQSTQFGSVTYVPIGGLTLIFGTQKWGFSCNKYRGDPLRASS
jgi:hypothetical protein